jgi:hypothetical protein
MKVIIFLLIFSLFGLLSEAAPGLAKEAEDSVRRDSGFFGHLTKGNEKNWFSNLILSSCFHIFKSTSMALLTCVQVYSVRVSGQKTKQMPI